VKGHGRLLGRGSRVELMVVSPGVCPGMKRGREKAPDCVVVMQHGGGGSR